MTSSVTRSSAAVLIGLAIAACKEPNPDFLGASWGVASTESSGGEASSSSSVESSTTTNSTGGSTSDQWGSTTAAVEDGSASTGGSSSGPTCDDVDGDHPTPADATDLGEQQCDELAEQNAGVLVAAGDQDWFVFHGKYVDDTVCGVEDPFTVVSVDQGALGVCAHLACDVGTATVLGCGVGVAANAPNGEPGCCGAAAVEMTFNCAGDANESATVLVQVSTADPIDCLPYTLSWNFDA